MEKGEIWIVELFSTTGREQTGTRPAMVIADTNTDLVLLIPLTSNLGALKKIPFTLEIEKSSENGLDKNSVALVFQLQAIDKRRLRNKIGKLEDSKMNNVNNVIKKMLNF